MLTTLFRMDAVRAALAMAAFGAAGLLAWSLSEPVTAASDWRMGATARPHAAEVASVRVHALRTTGSHRMRGAPAAPFTE